MHVPGTGYHVVPLERSWSVRSARARECSRHPCRIADREGTAIGYLPQKISPVCLSPRFQPPSEVRFRDRALGLSDLPGSGHHRQVSGSAAEPYLHFDSQKLTLIFDIEKFRVLIFAVPTKIKYGENFPIYSTWRS